MIKPLILAKVLKIKQNQISKLLQYYVLVQKLMNGDLIGDVKLRLSGLLKQSLNRLFKGVSISVGSNSVNKDKLQKAVDIVAKNYDKYQTAPSYEDLMAVYNEIKEA